jgi:hypothetical protein
MLLDSGSSQQHDADLSEGGDDCDGDNGGQTVEETSGTDDPETREEVDEASEADDSSSGGDSDADNGMGRKTGAVRVMVESFADRCVALSCKVGRCNSWELLSAVYQRVALGWLVPWLPKRSRCRSSPPASARNEFYCRNCRLPRMFSC